MKLHDVYVLYVWVCIRTCTCACNRVSKMRDGDVLRGAVVLITKTRGEG